MTKSKIFNKHTVILFCISLVLNGAFLYFNKKNLFAEGLVKHHGEIAYNLYKSNSIKVNRDRMGTLAELEYAKNRRVDYYEIDHEAYGPPTEYRNHYDSIGYGVLIGLLWKITGSLNYFDIQFLQVILFSLMLLLFFQIALMLFDKQTALFSSIALLLFFPAIFLNVQFLRDIWPFYSGVILLYVTLKYLLQKSSWVIPAIGGILVALFQFMRPHSFTLILTMSTVLVGYAIATKTFGRVFRLLLILFVTNIFFFWAPFAAYNKIAYDKYVVSAAGINMIQGLGEHENPWGYQLNDGWFSRFMNKNYPGMSPIEHDKKARELFWVAVKSHPWFYVQSIIRRVPRLVLPGLPWFNYQDKAELYHMYLTGTSLKEILTIVCRDPVILFDFLARHLYIGIFLLLAYLGMLLMLIRKKYFAFFIIFAGVICAGYSVVFMHTDHRYLIPYYAFFALFVGYFIKRLKN